MTAVHGDFAPSELVLVRAANREDLTAATERLAAFLEHHDDPSRTLSVSHALQRNTELFLGVFAEAPPEQHEHDVACRQFKVVLLLLA